MTRRIDQFSESFFHLRQIERTNFRSRFEKTLRNETEDWTLLVPDEMRLAQDKNTENNLAELLKDFLAERKIRRLA